MAKCVLIYDDDTEILFLCKVILQKEHYRVETRARCENIINDVELVQPDIILMDLWIPQIGGEQAITIIKENKATSHIPVIIFSANAEIAAVSEKIKANGYIEKPFDITYFKEIIKQHIL